MIDMKKFPKKFSVIFTITLIGFVGSTIADSTIPSTTNSDTDFTASTFVDKYQDLLQKGGARVSV